MSNKQTFTPFYEVASRSIESPARNAVKAEAGQRQKARIDYLINKRNLTPEEDAELAEWQAAQMENDAWTLDAAECQEQ